ncbi:MAG TPA: hypothetical protein VM658_00855 [bacterium]|nr:hypothetical protein [bacterium]
MCISTPVFRKTVLAFIFIFALILSGCTKQDAEEAGDESTEAAAPDRGDNSRAESAGRDRGDLPELTTGEAAALAYKEARKWRSDAVLWYIMPTSPDLRAGDNDLAWSWSLIYANPGDDKTFIALIKYGRITEAKEQTHVVREIPVPDDLPAKAPKVTLQDAARAIHKSGGSEWETPLCVYIVENSYQRFRGQATWDCLAASTQTLFTVDGLSGKVISIRDYKGTEIAPEAARGRPLAKNSERFKMARFIFGFFEAMDQGKYDAGLSMMDPALAGNKQTRDMWKQSFKGLSAVRAVSVFQEDPRKWTEGRPLFKAVIYAVPKSGDQSGGWDLGENTRFISLVPAGAGWKIAEIATGR